MRPFSCGSEFADWLLNNCDQCKKKTIEPRCDLEEALHAAYWGDGEITDEIAKRLGVRIETYKWYCKEIDTNE